MNRRNVGTGYELRAAQKLQAEGYEILEHSYRTRTGEIDLIARRRHTGFY